MNRIIIKSTAKVETSNDGEYCLQTCAFFKKSTSHGKKKLLCLLFNYFNIDDYELMEINGTPARSYQCKQNELKEGK